MQSKTKKSAARKYSVVQKLNHWLAILIVFLLGSIFNELVHLPLSKMAHAEFDRVSLSPSVANVNASGTTSLKFFASQALQAGQQIKITYDRSYAGELNRVNTTVNSQPPAQISIQPDGKGNHIATLSLAQDIAQNSYLIVNTTGLISPVSAGNYVFGVSLDDQPIGTAFQYVGQFNVVQVTAYVPVTLSFSIRNAEDTGDADECQLTAAEVDKISTCSYRLKVSTNSSHGYTISMQAGTDLTNGTDSILNAAYGPGTPIRPGQEMYGAIINAGQITGSGGTVNVPDRFRAAAGNVVAWNALQPVIILTADRPNHPEAIGDTAHTTLITHEFAISPNTPSGKYVQRITYNAAPSF